MYRFFVMGIVVALLALGGCSSFQGPKTSVDPISGLTLEELTPIQKKLLEGASWAEGQNQLNLKGRSYFMDCTGVVSAIYWYAGIDLQVDFPRYEGNGVLRLYRYLEDHNLTNLSPASLSPGDIIFWDNSYDKNANGLVDDELTHMAMVVEVSEEGDVTYIHENYSKGIVRERMNLLYPDDSERNSGMRMRSLGPTPEGDWNSGQLFRDLGRGYLISKND